MESKRYKRFKFLSVLKVDLSDDFSHKIIRHLSLLNAELLHYFPEATSCVYITDLFSVDPADCPSGLGSKRS